MRQQINLYQPIFTEERKLFSAATVGSGLAIVALALVALSWYASRGVARLERDVAALRTQQAQQEAMLAQADELKTKLEQPKDVELRVRALKASVAERVRALEILQSGAAGQTSGFATRLEALARRHVDGLWIDNVLLSGTNGGMSLAGGTLNPDIVPVYLRSLSRDAVLTGTRFDDFVIERPDDADGDEGDGKPASEADPSKHGKPVAARRVRFRAGSSSLAVMPQS